MKIFRIFVFLLIFLIPLSGCIQPTPHIGEVTSQFPQTPAVNELRGVWISYFEMDFGNLSESDFREKTQEMYKNAANFGLNALFVHVRSNSDAFYKSALFPFTKQLSGKDGSTPDYDPLEIMVEIAHELNLEFHAWINPYRVSAITENPADLQEGCPAKTWLTDTDESNDDWAVIAADGIYYNPAIPEVQKLILDGVREVVDGYDVDGIHYDDYFYPTIVETFDAAAYTRYKVEAGGIAMPLSDWRRANVNALVSGSYAICKVKNRVFGISPAAAVSTDHSDRNYTELYADYSHWMINSGYVDYIAPQLYFGFDYPAPSFTYERLVTTWAAVPRLPSVKLYIGLAGYKIGKTDYDTNEWIENTDILKRQVVRANELQANGFIIFSYESFVNDIEMFKEQMENLKEVQ